MFGLLKRKKKFFTEEEKERIVEAVRQAEVTTSGELRVFVESRCAYLDALDRAAEVFFKLEMDQTEQHNAVLLYLAMEDHQLAIFGDQAIHEKAGQQYWDQEIRKILASFDGNQVAEGIVLCIKDIGELLQAYYPYNAQTDKNELPDDIVFGH